MPALRLIAVAACLCPWALGAAPALAQMSLGEPVAAAGAQVLILDSNRLYTASRYGRRMLAETEAEGRALASENRDLEAALEAEEKALADRRAALPPAEFQALAQTFDAKVREIRRARSAKERDFEERKDQSQRAFFQRVLPVLNQILEESGADVILDRSAAIITTARVDITDLAIARIDATLPNAAAGPAPAGPEAAGND